MIFQRINASDAEKVFAIFQNVSGGTFPAGYPGVWSGTTADGARVTKPATALLSLFVGISVRAIPNNGFGLFQVYGFKSQAWVTCHTTQAIAAGDILIPVDAQWYLARSGPGDGKSGFVYAGSAVATGTQAAMWPVFIRAM